MRSLALVISMALVGACGGGGGDANNNNENSNGNVHCGNGIVEDGEHCDDGPDNSDIDPDACRSNCVAAGCGDGVRDSAEQCDGDDLNGEICADHPPYTQGGIGCTLDCEFDLSECFECGNGVQEPGEVCDGTDFGGASCSTIAGQQHGFLQCLTDCTADTSQCHTCGDGIIEAGLEECEAGDLQGVTCEDLGYVYGELTCNVADESCQFAPEVGCRGFCGNGTINGDEECDGDDVPAVSCSDIDPNLTGGTVTCSYGCLVSLAQCNTCGNAVLDSDEECDGAILGGETCVTLGGLGGNLGCAANCRFDTSQCTPAATCGNGLVEAGEECDGANMAGNTCLNHGGGDVYVDGPLTCSSSCLLDTSQCIQPGECGNGVWQPAMGEMCDGTDLGSTTCVALGYATGTLGCTDQCTYDYAGCGVPPGCGNGVIDPGERCDTTIPPGVSCPGLGFVGGSIGCDALCELDVSGCTRCGNGIKDPLEQCDGADLGGLTCTDTNPPHVSGTLACTPGSCTLDTSGCNFCGNGIINAGEDCDATEFGSQSCSTETGGALTHGTLGCTPGSCTLDTSGCHQCGNFNLEGPEQCEWHLVGPGTCAVQFPTLYDGGALGCTADCSDYDVSSCYAINDGICLSPVENIANSPNDCGWLQISAGFNHTCGIRGDGTLWCWGRATSGQLGMGPHPNTYYSAPQAVVNLPGPVVQVSAGERHTCAIVGTDLYCWGTNSYGQLGNNAVVGEDEPAPVSTIFGVSRVEAGNQYTCALRFNGTAHCWGVNAAGVLGDGSVIDRHVPVAVSTLSAATDIAVSPHTETGFNGGMHTCAVQLGNAYCWGDNSSGQLGVSGTGPFTTPQAVVGLSSGVARITVSAVTTCALVGGVVYCWGYDASGQLGDGFNDSSGQAPRAALTLTAVDQVAMGHKHICARRSTDKSAWCWGDNGQGQVGNGTGPGNMWEPTQVLDAPVGNPFTQVVSIVSGYQHSCAIVESGHAFCWGDGDDAQLGNGLLGDRNVPTQVSEPL